MTVLNDKEIQKAAHEQRKKGAIQLGSVPSKSNPGSSHGIMLGSDNLVYCECTGWEQRHKCSHLDAFKLALKEKTK